MKRLNCKSQLMYKIYTYFENEYIENDELRGDSFVNDYFRVKKWLTNFSELKFDLILWDNTIDKIVIFKHENKYYYIDSDFMFNEISLKRYYEFIGEMYVESLTGDEL